MSCSARTCTRSSETQCLVVSHVVHIKEAVGCRMSAVDEIRDEVAYIGLKEGDLHLQLYASIMEQDFNAKVDEKLKRKKTISFDTDQMKQKLRQYLEEKVSAIATLLKLIVVTDFKTDHLLTVQQANACFVYFGAITEHELIHVACWLKIPMKEKEIDIATTPQIFFWVLHMSYAQELEALGDLEEGINVEQAKELLGF